MANSVTVVGAGVIGLSCAVLLAEAGYDVEVVSRDDPATVTSAVAGGLWLPYRAEPAPRVARWGRDTLAALLALHGDEPAAGVLVRDGVLLHHEPPPEPDWAAEVADLAPYRVLTDPAPGYRYGIGLRVPVVDMPRYLAYLQDRLRRARGRQTRAQLSALPARAVVVNAAGLAARELVGDATVHPVRGQVAVLEYSGSPGLTRWLVDEHEVDGELTYVLPRAGDVIVGGSATEHDANASVDADLARRMLERAYRLEPRLREATVRAHRVGLRPARPTVRLEPELREHGTVVHCYGHGGAGVTLSWGCAAEVLDLVRTLDR